MLVKPQRCILLLIVSSALGLSGCNSASLTAPGSMLASLRPEPPSKKVSLMLPMRGRWAKEAKQLSQGVQDQFYQEAKQDPYKELQLLDSSATATAILYHRAVEDGSQVMIGPLTKLEVASVSAIANLTIPVLALNNAESLNYTPVNNLYFLGPSVFEEVKQVTERLKRQGITSCAVVVEDNKNSQKVAQHVIRQLSRSQIAAPSLYLKRGENLSKQVCSFLSAAGSNDALCDPNLRRKVNEEDELGAQQLLRDDLGAVLLLTSPDYTAQLVPLLKFYYVSNWPVMTLANGWDFNLNATDLEGLEWLEMPYVMAVFNDPQLAKKESAPIEPPAAPDAIAQENANAAIKPETSIGTTAAPSVVSNVSTVQETSWPNGAANRFRLYAIGLDVYTIAGNWHQFITKLAKTPWLGASGWLSIDKNRFSRHLEWVRMKNGKLVKVADEPSI